MKFFWQNAKGLKADVERHRAKEKEYMDKIAELEGKEDPMSVAALEYTVGILTCYSKARLML